jgi:hypothetical protein
VLLLLTENIMVKMADGASSTTPAPAPNPVPVTPGSRYEKSLGLLTTRFVTLLQKAKDGVLDLKEVSPIQFIYIYKHYNCTQTAAAAGPVIEFHAKII